MSLSLIVQIKQLADDTPVRCIDLIILVNSCIWHLFVTHTNHETHDKINTLTWMTLVSRAIKHVVKRTDSYNSFKHWLTLQHVIPQLCCQTFFRAEGYHACCNILREPTHTSCISIALAIVAIL